MTRSRAWIFVCAALVASTGMCWGQKASNWRVFRVADGMPEATCISVSITGQGKVLAGHMNRGEATELDGYSLNLLTVPENGKGRIYGSPGGQLWTVAPEGILEYRENTWSLRRVPEIAAEMQNGPTRLVDPIPLVPIRQGLALFLLPDRLVELNSEDLEHPRTKVLKMANQTSLEKFSSLTIGKDGGLWISGVRGIAQAPGPLRSLKPEMPWREFPIPAGLAAANLMEPHEDETGITTLAENPTNHQKLVLHFNGQTWQSATAGPEKLRQAWRSSDHVSWVMGVLGLYASPEGQVDYAETVEISPRQYYDVAVELGGAFWLATSDGLFRYAPLTWRTPSPVGSLNLPVRCLCTDADGHLWFIAGAALYRCQNEQVERYPFPPDVVRVLQAARAMLPLKDESLVIDGGEQLFRFHPESGRFTAILGGAAGGERKLVGEFKDGSLCLQTESGNNPGLACELERFDGQRFEPFPNPPPAALGENLLCLYPAANGDLWLSSETAIARYHDHEWHAFTSSDKSAPEGILGLVETPDGKLWGGSRDQLWEFDGRNWSVIRRGFEGINCLTKTRDGSVWVASNNGLHRYFQSAWVENGTEEGLPSASVREIREDSRGRLWAGTTRGLSLYHPDADTDPPQTAIQQLADNEKNLREGATINLAFSGVDKWKFTPRGRLLYSYRLDQREWSAFQEVSQASFTDLPAGKHYFQVRTMDRNCNIDPKPAGLEFAVILPWYRELRLMLIACAGAVAALFFAGLAFNRHRQLLRSYAEVGQKVTERTRQLEMANRELLHSQKMNALGSLAAGIAHDFNNILSIIKGSAQVIEDNLDNPEKIRTRAERINTVVEQGAGIVKAMLGFSRESGKEPVVCDVNSVVEDTMKLLGDRFLHEVQVTPQLGANLPLVLASRDFIQQILLNFIFNAAESMTQDKRITLASRFIKEPPSGPALQPEPAEGYVAVEVTDTGCGIPPENLARIFEPFFTTKALSTRRGTGLGLSMAYELAKTLGAGLSVKSELNRGSTFTLILPVRDPAEKPSNT